MSFQSVAGQTMAVAMLRADLARRRLPLAYLFAGPDGVGKRLLAMELAKALNCDAGGDDACDHCPTCLKIAHHNHPDIWWLEPSTPHEMLKIERVRELLPRIGMRPFAGRHQLLIIAGAEQLTEEAANALLKTLEEPAHNTLFILTTANRSACLPTIVSRCRLIPCTRLLASLIVERLTADHGVNHDAAAALARVADGSLCRALERHQAGWWERQQELQRMIRQGDWQALANELPAGEATRPWVQETLELLVWTYRQQALEASASGDGAGASAMADRTERLLRLLDHVNRYANTKLVWALALDYLQETERVTA